MPNIWDPQPAVISFGMLIAGKSQVKMLNNRHMAKGFPNRMIAIRPLSCTTEIF